MAEGGSDDIESSGRIRQRNLTLDWEGIDAESLRKLKQVRGSKKGIVTRLHDEIRQLMTDRLNASQVKEKLDQLHKAFEEFSRAHIAYHDRLEDLYDIEDSHEYFKSVEQSHGRLAGEISRWIVAPTAPNGSDSNNPLEVNIRDLLDDVTPSDSVSNAGSGSRASSKSSRHSVRSEKSTSSSVLSARAKAAAKKAMLEAEATKLEEWQALQKEELALQLKRRALEIQTEIAKAQAEELAYAQAESGDRRSLTEEDNTGKSLKGTQQHSATDSAQNVYSQRKDRAQGQDTLTKTPEIPLGVSESTKLDASTTPQQNCNLRDAKQSPSASLKVKSEIYEPTHGGNLSDSTGNDALVRQLLEAQFFQSQQLQALVQRQQESTLALTLPQPDVPVFSGNPIEYWTFIRAFENLIDKKTTCESARLYYLVQYTSGEVQELVKSCLSMSEESGYRTARNLLQKEYGSSYKIASTYVEKLSSGPTIKAEDGEALKRFSIALTGCKNTLTEIGYLSKLENPDTLRAIVQRLPFGLRQKWRDVADNITETQNREITIADLSDFVSAKARAATHAVFGNISSQPLQSLGGSEARRRPPPRTRSSFGTQAETSQEHDNIEMQSNQAGRKCPLCKSDHWLSQCDTFKEKSLAARWQYVNSENLCSNCLVAGHSAHSCPKKGFCRVTGCNGKHSSYLHPRGQVTAAINGVTNSPTTEAQAQTYNRENEQTIFNGYAKDAKDDRSSLALVPVKVKAPGSDLIVKTYAFLDNGSNASFCSEELATELGLSGRPMSLTLTTMEREESRSTPQVVSLQVMDIEEENAVELPCVFTRPKLPVAVENGAQQEDVDRWPHLAGIRITKIDANVGLLIGSDAPEVLQPKEVRESCHNGPYATRTIFGWVVNGPLGRVQGPNFYTANFIRADTELSEQFQS